MTARHPIVIVNGKLQQLQPGDAIPLSDVSGAAASGANADITSLSAQITISGSATAISSLPATVSGTALRIVGADGAVSQTLSDGFGNAGVLVFRRANTGAVSPSSLASNDTIGNIVVRGYGSTGYSGGGRASMGFFAAEPWTDSAHGTFVQWGTTKIGTTSQAVQMKLFDTGALQIALGSAAPAGGTTGLGLLIGSSGSLGVFFGSGVPTLSAGKGSLYLRTDGSSTSTRMYVNTDGGTTWTAVTTAS
jgi:hypothetical protein